MVKIKVKVTGVDRVTAKLSKVKGAIDTVRPALNKVAPKITKEFKTNFDTAGGTLKSKWAPRVRDYPWPLLVKSGTMKKSWDKEAQAKKLTIENTSPYAGYHHFGTATLPVRRLVGSTSRIVKMIKAAIIEHVKKHIR